MQHSGQHLPGDLSGPQHVPGDALREHLPADAMQHVQHLPHLRHVPDHPVRLRNYERKCQHLSISLPAAVTTVAQNVALDVAHRLADPAVLRSAVGAAAGQTAFPTVGWRPATLAAGHPGLAVLFGTLAARWPDEGWEEVGHAQLAQAIEASAADAPLPSLFGGLAGIGFAADLLAAGRDRYRRLLTGVDAELIPRTEAIARRLEGARGCAVSDFDLISGLSGVGAYLLARREHPEAGRALREVLTRLTELLADPAEPRRWHTPAELAGDAMRVSYPDGCHNCGLAHGVPGPLALLSIAAMEGVEVAGARSAMNVTAGWLARCSVDDEWGPNWPNAVPLHGPPQVADRSGTILSRATWCYGAPGVVRALWLAGQALGVDEFCELALAGIRAALARPPDLQDLTSPTFCHGTAGLLQITMRFAWDTGLADIVAAADALTCDLLARYRPESLLGYCNVEPGGIVVDQPGLLDGACGVALTLLTAAGPVAAGAPTPAAWDRLFLIS